MREIKIPTLEAALLEIETIINESAGACRKRMGTRLGNVLVVAKTMRDRAKASDMALLSFAKEREAIAHCDSLSNPEYRRLMDESRAAKNQAEAFLENQK